MKTNKQYAQAYLIQTEVTTLREMAKKYKMPWDDLALRIRLGLKEIINNSTSKDTL